MKKSHKNRAERGLPGELIRAGAGQQHGLLGKTGHGVTQRVGEVHGVMHSRVVKLHVDGVVLLVIVASHYSHRVPHLRHNLDNQFLSYYNKKMIPAASFLTQSVSESYHEAVREMCRGGAWLKRLLGRRWQGSLIDGTGGHQRGSCRPDNAARVVIVPELVLTEPQRTCV